MAKTMCRGSGIHVGTDLQGDKLDELSSFSLGSTNEEDDDDDPEMGADIGKRKQPRGALGVAI